VKRHAAVEQQLAALAPRITRTFTHNGEVAWRAFDAGDPEGASWLTLVTEFLVQREGRKFEADRETWLKHQRALLGYAA
jgi:hypothetical protein